MRPIGFSTGAIAKGDFRLGMQLQSDCGATAVELSALRECEIVPLMTALPSLKLDAYKYVSFHAPSSLQSMREDELFRHLSQVSDYGIPIVVHPNLVQTPPLWRQLGASVLLENMDQRKGLARTVCEMQPYFDTLPDARFCFDIGHARQVDPTMATAVDFLLEYKCRLAEIHLSEVSAQCRHVQLSFAAMHAFRRVSSLIPRDVPVIIESMISADLIDKEFRSARVCFDFEPSPERRFFVA